MKRFESFTGGPADKATNPLMWLMALMLAVFVAGCSGGQGSILGLPAVNLVSVAVTSVPTPASVPILGIQQFTATAVYSDGTSRDVTATSVWSSGTPAVATVVANTGVATGVAPGTSLITATFGGQTSPAATLTVTAATLTSIAVASIPTPATVSIGVTQQFIATASYSDGSSINVTTSAAWTSGTPAVALVGLNTGLATGVTAGTSAITAAFGGKTSPAATLTVTAATVVSIAVSPAAFSIAANGNKQFTATATMSFGPPVDVTASAAWASGTPAVALVGLNTGLATGVAAGTSAITATFGGHTSPAATLTVTAATVVSIAVTPAAFSIAANGNKQFTATATMSFGPPVDVTASAAWASGTPAVALVGLNTGLATGVAAGTSAITATFGGHTSPAATLTVTAATVVSVAVSPAAFSIPANGNKQFTATATMSFGPPVDVTASAAWASGTPAVALVGLNTGLATGVAAGTSAITATFGGHTSPAATLTVTAATVVSIAVTPPAFSIPANGNKQFTATATMSFGPTVDVTTSAAWASGTPAVALVGLNTGLATGVAAGTSAITATFGGQTSPAATLTVTAATVVSIAVTPATFSVAIAGNKQFTATATMSFGPTVDVTASAAWASGTPAVATVGLNTGLATGVTAGTSAITATFGGQTSPAATLTVNAALPVLPGIAGTPGANATNPTVIATNPSNGDTNVPTRIQNNLAPYVVHAKWVTATFDEAMDPTTITPVGTFTLWDNTLGQAVAGTVTMNVANTIATFKPTAAALNAGTSYTATVTTAAKNAGSITAMPKDVAWSFTTMAANGATQTANVPFIGQDPVDLLSTYNFVILAKTAITDVPASIITGDIGLSPATGAAIGVTCPEVTGVIYAVDAAGPGCFTIDAVRLTAAISDRLTAYNEAAARPTPDATELFVGNLSGQTIEPGLYKWSTDVLVNIGNVTLDAKGDTNAIWIFQIAGNLTTAASGALPGVQVILANGAKAANVFWQVGGGVGATLGTHSTFNGNILSFTQVVANTGAVVDGRLFADSQVTLQQNTITKPAP